MGVGVHFTRKPYNPIYFNNGSDANLVWDYADPHNNVQSTLYSVQVAGAFVKMMVNDSRGVQEHPDIPPSYKGRVKIEGSATLVIKNINPEDNTRFKCEVRGSFFYSVQCSLLWQVCITDLPLLIKHKLNAFNSGLIFLISAQTFIFRAESGL